MSQTTTIRYNPAPQASLTVLLTVLFVALKLIGVIGWSWVWVLSPIWISAGLLVIVFVIAFLVALVALGRR